MLLYYSLLSFFLLLVTLQNRQNHLNAMRTILKTKKSHIRASWINCKQEKLKKTSGTLELFHAKIEFLEICASYKLPADWAKLFDTQAWRFVGVLFPCNLIAKKYYSNTIVRAFILLFIKIAFEILKFKGILESFNCCFHSKILFHLEDMFLFEINKQ